MPHRDLWLWPLGIALRGRRPGPTRSLRHTPELASTTTIELTSPAFPHGGVIDRRHSGLGRGANLSPELRWAPVPAGTAELLLVMEDVDVPFTEPGIHLAALLPAELTGVTEGELVPGRPGIRWLPDRRGRTGYHGPRPLPGHGDHRYGFHLFALDTAVPEELLAAATVRTEGERAAGDSHATAVRHLVPHLAGHVLARGFLEGRQRG
ncbi:hypothetical protein CELL_00180 [Cellulomonas sp. T2.31MG-18]|uniref:YbhB/YbcL family Raf kinase inhibitor-like protein n=1 Tax=Cellulomonas sp. T2.31MG-18 TaxID=3157619 RepID=UPI0035F04503